MLAIFLKEFNSFFSSAIGFVVAGLFLLATGVLVWVLPGSFNIFDQGYSNLTPFFEVLPWIFCVLIPAICMRSFSEEKKQGTLELLLTKPISINQLIVGKFLGSFSLSVIALLPTLFYIISISELSAEGVRVDYGVIFSSYVGVLLLMSCFTSIGTFASCLTDNSLIAFVIGTSLSVLLYFGSVGVSSIPLWDSQLYTLDYFSLSHHFRSISRGILDSRNLIYFISISLFFLVLTHLQLKSNLK
ncbi:gliding motility-associated ABC transporter permease subunit GldF [Psychroflexus sp. MES1-P1E]|uniref:gliding motility-associated ABC transporter permease subunit GldF n=1 Tax=Psychroflexus sp. MES1-P1E TaxID=2058320 RepID=UPI000C7A7D5A|nr:gliding motility-associated ABC transporter permease subunit GldF [Psychroflexus sp. MES1-P1E]PKG42929.1 gliding motility-associated ABC transporter permease subunit GldF [Psychroflexus sp. MES1-P1E]